MAMSLLSPYLPRTHTLEGTCGLSLARGADVTLTFARLIPTCGEDMQPL